MNFRGGCCIARYGGGGASYDTSKVDRIMLRFRPIAPRPAIGGSSSPPDINESAKVSTKSGRGRRKNTKESSNSNGSVNSNGNSKRCNKRRREEPKEDGSAGGGASTDVVTLPLLPEVPEKKGLAAPVAATVLNSPWLTAPFWLSFGDGRSDGRYQMTTKLSDLTETATSCVTVECITDTWVEGGYELGLTDEERKMNLQRDTCPGFLSDVMGRVTWTNGPYRELVVGNNDDRNGNAKIMVWLVMKERPMLLTKPAFTCRVRLQCNKGKSSNMTFPCDVWRMNDGGFAWRLDVNAALCLGR